MSELTQAEKDALGCRVVTQDEENDALLTAVYGNPLTGYWYIDRKKFNVKPIQYWLSGKSDESS